MKRGNQFSFRVNKQERELIRSLASQLNRSQSDAIRFLVILGARGYLKVAIPNSPPINIENKLN